MARKSHGKSPMAEEKSKKPKTEAKSSEGGWLKLPKMWADTADKTDEARTEAPPAARIQPDAGSTASEPLVRAEAPVSPTPVSPTPVSPTPVSPTRVPATPVSATPVSATPVSAVEAREEQSLHLDFEEMKAEMERMHHIVNELNERESSMEQVFNTLHSELMDYKKDFIYEHLKPIVRPLLFLYDSLEQFDREIELYERPHTDERRQTGLAPRLVRENIGYFREQLVEALRICEVTQMETPAGAFLPRLHKAIDVAPVDQSQDNQIIRVVRAGWYLNNQVLRPAEVVVGKAVPHPRSLAPVSAEESDDPDPLLVNIE
jgi:molecular chaperone GrpE (heat shock protein)